MNNEYYGVASTPTEDYLAHYGVKGMKWGVRKALEKGNTKRLDREFRKAQKKLNKLSKRADIGAQEASYKKYKTATKGGLAATGALLGVAGVGTGVSALGRKMKRNAVNAQNLEKLNIASEGIKRSKLYDNAYIKDKVSKDSYKKMSKANLELMARQGAAADAKAQKALNLGQKHVDWGRNIQAASAGAAAGGLLYSGIVGSKALAAKYRTTKKGHAKAVAKRDAWQNEMAKTFSGTKYGKKRR